MAKVRLELDFIEIERKRRRWNLYFIIATEHPEDPQKTVLTVTPSEPIRLTGMDNNRIDFVPKGNGNELNGLFILERNMPADNSIRARMWIVQSHDHTRAIGDVLQEISKSTEGNKLADKALTALGDTNPWIAVGKSLISLGGTMGEILKNSKDTKKGFVNMDEIFTPEEIDLGELDRSNKVTGFGEAGWTWIIDK